LRAINPTSFVCVQTDKLSVRDGHEPGAMEVNLCSRDSSIVDSGGPGFKRFLLCFLPLLRRFKSVARQVEFKDHAVMHKPVHGRRRDRGILEDLLPLGEGQVTGDQQTSAFVALRQYVKEQVHLLATVLHIAQTVHDEGFVAQELFHELRQTLLALGLD